MPPCRIPVSLFPIATRDLTLMVDTQTKPPLEDPLHEREIFANEVAGIAMIHGNFIVTLAKVRFEDATEGQTAKVRRIVSGRLV